jgi:MFS family permease
MFPLVRYIQRNVEDTPEFRQILSVAREHADAVKEQASSHVMRDAQQIVLGAIAFLPSTIGFYIVVTGLIDYSTQNLQLPQGTVLAAVMIGMVPFGIGIAGASWLSDLVGRRRVYAAGSVFSGVWAFAMFPLVDTRDFPLILLGAGVGLLAAGSMLGIGSALFGETFRAQNRYLSASLGYQVSNVLGGGLAPFIMVALLSQTHTAVSVSAYMAASSVLSLMALALVRN